MDQRKLRLGTIWKAMSGEEKRGLIGSVITRPFSSKKALMNWGFFLVMPYMTLVMQAMFVEGSNPGTSSIENNLDALVHSFSSFFAFLRAHISWYYLGLAGLAVFISFLFLKERAMEWVKGNEALKQRLEIQQEKEFLRNTVPQASGISSKRRL